MFKVAQFIDVATKWQLNEILWLEKNCLCLIAPTSLKDKKFIVEKPSELEVRGRHEHAVKEEEADKRKVDQHHSNDFPLIE